MNKRTYAVVMALLLTITAINSHAATGDDRKPLKERVSTMTEDQKAARLEEIKSRTEQIKNMDKSTLTRSERRALKKELREMNREARTMKGGVYLSVAAIIIIILVLILIL